ncbi:hypothetical protein OSTOST_08008 [Ostertagia ostertagi]
MQARPDLSKHFVSYPMEERSVRYVLDDTEEDEDRAMVPVNSCRPFHVETFWKVNLISLVRYERERAIAAAKEADRIQNLFLRKAAMKERDLRMNFQRALHAHDPPLCNGCGDTSLEARMLTAFYIEARDEADQQEELNRRQLRELEAWEVNVGDTSTNVEEFICFLHAYEYVHSTEVIAFKDFVESGVRIGQIEGHLPFEPIEIGEGDLPEPEL